MQLVAWLIVQISLCTVICTFVKNKKNSCSVCFTKPNLCVVCEGFVEVVIPSFDDDEFRRHFRVSRETFEFLANALGRHVSNQFVDKVGRRTVDC